MANSLIVSVSGVRGIVGRDLTPEVASRFAAALGTLVQGGRVVLGRDSRPSGAMLARAAIAGLQSAGCEVLDIGIAPTPTVGVAVRAYDAVGGLQITASHNPSPWNGLKLFGTDGAVLPAEVGEQVRGWYESGSLRRVGWDAVGSVQARSDACDRHAAAVLRLVDAALIRTVWPAVYLDANGGAGGPLGTSLLQALGARVIDCACEPDGRFRHEPEPIPAHLGEVAAAVADANVRAGFVLDPDADRLALIDGSGQCLSEELTLALAVLHRLEQQPGPVVINMSTSRAVEDLCRRFGVPCHRSPVGEAHVVARMRAVGAIIGGEGNGGVIDPRVGWVRDPFVGMAMILDRLARTRKTLAELVAELPRYTIVKDKYDLPRERLEPAFAALQARWPKTRVNRADGLRLDWDHRWVHVRGSNTEPIVRVIAEAPTAEEARALCQEVGDLLR